MVTPYAARAINFDGAKPGASAAAAAVPAIGPTKEVAAQSAPQAVPQPPQIPQRPHVYTMSTSWRRGILGFGFSALEKLGMQAEAENAALTACKAAGNIHCEVTDSSLVSCNLLECSAKATARDVRPSSGDLYEMVSGQSGRIRFAKEFSALEKLGIEKSARDAALGLCQWRG
ncbi:MAG: hypothetical protein HY554_19505, partial [Elusimicrobia bacterium]|nr:hypothetical protein [Elusimicrobiota bacterium]